MKEAGVLSVRKQYKGNSNVTFCIEPTQVLAVLKFFKP